MLHIEVLIIHDLDPAVSTNWYHNKNENEFFNSEKIVWGDEGASSAEHSIFIELSLNHQLPTLRQWLPPSSMNGKKFNRFTRRIVLRQQ